MRLCPECGKAHGRAPCPKPATTEEIRTELSKYLDDLKIWQDRPNKSRLIIGKSV